MTFHPEPQQTYGPCEKHVRLSSLVFGSLAVVAPAVPADVSRTGGDVSVVIFRCTDFF